MQHQYQDLITLFNRCFKDNYRTVLVKGDGEPIYIPQQDATTHHQLIFAHGFYASALHEISHWCVASDERRQLEDFGYWYKPDGRTAEEQRAFEQVEVKPQALEWIFSAATGYRFRVSADNVAGGIGASDEFKMKVHQQVIDYLEKGLPDRAEQFLTALLDFYKPEQALLPSSFSLATL